MNRVSKSLFLKYLRCPRSAFFEGQTSQLVYAYKDTLANLTSEEERILLKAEFNEKIISLIQDFPHDAGEDDEEEDEEKLDFSKFLMDDKLLAVMNETYFKIEEYAGKKAINQFGGTVLSGKRDGANVYGQKILNLFEDGFNFYTFADIYQEDDNAIRLIEVKATTSKKFVNFGYKPRGKDFVGVFTQTPSGNLILTDDVDPSVVTEQYSKKRLQLFDRNHECGKYVYDLAWQRYLLEKSGKHSQKPIKYYLAVLNTNYRYDGKTDETGANLYDENELVIFIDLTTITAEMLPIIEKDFTIVKQRILQPNGAVVAIEKAKCLYGKGFSQCPWFHVCKKDKDIPDYNSIFVYIQGHHGFTNPDTDEKYFRDDLIEMKITHALDIDYNWLKDIQKLQYRVLESGVTYIDKAFIRNYLADLKYPLYHLDFETMNYPIPVFKGESPYQQSVFQFSIHVEETPNQSDSAIRHYEFLANGKIDEREALIKAMIAAIPNNKQGMVVAYNQGFEKGRIKELAKAFPKYYDDLMAIHDRAIDLMHFLKPNDEVRQAYGPIEGKMEKVTFYDQKLQRSYSIKKVLPIFVPSLDYGLLEDVHNGTEAQIAYLLQTKLSGQELEKLRRNMLLYCQQDTWAMVEILRALRKLV